jgi:hypothetical protein
MHFTTSLAVLTSLAAMTAATPVDRNAVASPPLNNTDLGLVAARQSGTPGAMCGFQFHPTFPYVGIYMPNNLMPSAQGTGAWGGGLIDNLRGSETAPLDWCNPLQWQAVTDNAGTGLAAVFNVEVGCTGDDVAHALNAASGVWVICADDIGADTDTLISIGASVATVLAPFAAAK